jgi:hypothetical protein
MGFFFEYFSICYLLKHPSLSVVDKTYQRRLIHKKYAVPLVDTSISAASAASGDADKVLEEEEKDEELFVNDHDVVDKSNCYLYHLSSRSCRFNSPNFPYNLSTLFIPEAFNFIAFDAMCTCSHSPEIANAIKTALASPRRTSPRFKEQADAKAQSPQLAPAPTHHLVFIQVTTAQYHKIRNINGAMKVVDEWKRKANEWAATQTETVVFGDPILLFIIPGANHLQYHSSYASAGLDVQFVMKLSGMSPDNPVDGHNDRSIRKYDSVDDGKPSKKAKTG